MKTLFDTVKIGKLQAKNRVFLAPMSRLRANIDRVPNELMAEYYSQRAEYFGLVVTESTPVNATCDSFKGSGGIYNDAQVEGWKKVVDKVHSKGGLISLQLFHGGRVGTKELLGGDVLGPSPIAAIGQDFFSKKSYEVPKELKKDQIKQIISDFHRGAVLAKKAGFDGVMVHGGNGFLIDQFLRDASNIRTDEYGGSVQNRSRFALETIDSVLSVYEAGRVSLRLSPTDRFNSMYDSNPLALLQYLLPTVDKKGLSYVEVKRNSPFDPSKDKSGRPTPEQQIPDFFKTVKSLLKNTPYVANQSITIEEAKALVENNIADAISFGSLGIANPDLPLRIQHNYEINRNIDFSKSYGGGAAGYTDYPFYKPK